MAFSSLGYPCPPLEVARLKSLSLLRTDFEPDRVKMKHESPRRRAVFLTGGLKCLPERMLIPYGTSVNTEPTSEAPRYVVVPYSKPPWKITMLLFGFCPLLPKS